MEKAEEIIIEFEDRKWKLFIIRNIKKTEKIIRVQENHRRQSERSKYSMWEL